MSNDTFLHLFIDSREQLAIEIERILTSSRQTDSIFPFDQVFFDDVTTHCISGKFFRGSLFLMVTEFLLKHLKLDIDQQDVLKIAAALELYGSGVLIHDDIMDKDELRRGNPTLHVKWQEYCKQQQIADPEHWARSAAICAGDYLYFMAGSVLGDLTLSNEISAKLMAESQLQLRLLGLAQIEDLRLAGLQKFPTVEAIHKMFEGKTGRYTGEWPLAFSGIVSGLSGREITLFRKVGIELGILYQLADDKLGIFGHSKNTGKSSNSDIREGKKTLYSGELHELVAKKANPEDLKVFQTVFGNHLATDEQCDTFRQLIKSYHVDSSIDAAIEGSVQKCHSLIDNLDLKGDINLLLHWVTDFIAERDW